MDSHQMFSLTNLNRTLPGRQKIAGFGAFGFDGAHWPLDQLGRQPLALEF
jgi:hypothetical protein